MLHNAIKQFRMGFLCFFLKEQKPVSFKKKPTKRIKKNKNPRRLGIKKTGFFSTLIIF